MEQSPPEKLTVIQLVKNFCAFYGTRRLITVFTKTHHLSPILNVINPVHIFPPISLSSILILSSHPRLGLPNGLPPRSDFPTNIFYTFLTTLMPSPSHPP